MISNTKDLVAAPLSLFIPSFFTFGYFIVSSDAFEARSLFVAARVFLLAFPVLWTLLVDRKRFPIPRIKKDGVAAGFLTGLIITFAGLILFHTIFKDLLPVDDVRDKAALFGISGSNYLFYGLLMVVGNSSLEEYYWRWFNFLKLKSVLSPGKAALFSSLGFTVHHVLVLTVYFGFPFAVLLGACVFAGGVIFVYLYRKYDCIWSPWICHAVIDAGIMVVGYTMLFT